MKTTLSICFLCVSFAAVAAGPALELRGLSINGTTSTEVERRVFADGEAVRYRLPAGARRITAKDRLDIGCKPLGGYVARLRRR